MLESGLIEIDYAAVLIQLTKLQNAKSDLETASKDAQRLLSSVESSWKGRAKDAFVNKINEFITSNNKTATNIGNEITRIKKLAGTLRDADSRIAASFK